MSEQSIVRGPDAPLDFDPAQLAREQHRLSMALAAGEKIREGTDDSGAITLVLNDAGVACDVLVQPDWRRLLRPDQVGAAVVAADADAARRRMEATFAILDSSTVDTEPPAPPSTVDGGGMLRPVPPRSGERRSLTDLTEAVWAAFDDLETVSTPPTPLTGSDAGGAVRITMTGGRVTECDISHRWLDRQDDITLAHGLRRALSDAAEAVARARRPLIEYQRRLDDLIAEATATLDAMTVRRAALAADPSGAQA